MPQPNEIHSRITYRIRHENDDIGQLFSSRSVGEWQGNKAIIVADELNIHVESFWSHYSLHTRETVTITDAGMVCYSGISVEDGQRSSLEARLDGQCLVMDVEEDGESYTNKLHRSQFDASSEEVAERFITSGEISKTLRVIDLDDFEVVSTLYKNAGRQQVEIAGREFSSFVLGFHNSRKKGRQWVTEDETGIWLLKEEGTDNEGAYSITMTEYQGSGQ